MTLEQIPLAQDFLAACRFAAVLLLFSWRWLRSRRLWRLAVSLPAIILALGFAGSMFLARSPDYQQQLLTKYLEAARASNHSKDLKGLRLNYRRVLMLSGGTPDITFEYAQALHQQQAFDEAYQVLFRLAPLQKTGYLPAHRFLIDHPPMDDSKSRLAFQAAHLGRLIQGRSDNRNERLELVALLTSAGRLDQVETILRQTLDRYPEDRLTLARLQAQAGHLQEARREAALACGTLRQRLMAEPQNVERRIQVAQSHVFQGQFPEALSVLGGSQDLDSRPLRDAILKTYGVWFSILDPDSRRRQHEALCSILESSGPKDRKLTGIADHLALFENEVLGDRSPWLIPVLTGTAAAIQGDLSGAEHYFRSALQKSPSEPAAQNNLAWVLAESHRRGPEGRSVCCPGPEVFTTEPDPRGPESLSATLVNKSLQLTEALQLSNAAVAARPKLSAFRETRGQILFLLGRNEEAVQELQGCLEAGGETSAEIQKTLSECRSRLVGRLEFQKESAHSEVSQPPAR